MNGKLLVFIHRIRSSYWFLPSVLALAAAALAAGAVAFDNWLGTSWLESLTWLAWSEPEGARTLLSTIAGSMITVAGVTFSITVAAVASATNQFGPRLVTNFLRDRGNQLTLGVFIATFIYCLLVLRSVLNEHGDSAAFVPQVSLMIAIVLALASIGVLIFFIHHVPQSVHVSYLIAAVGRELVEMVDNTFPERIGAAQVQEDEAAARDLARSSKKQYAICARDVGYVQQIDGELLIEVARKADAVISVDCQPGSFIRHGTTLAYMISDHPPTDEQQSKIGSAFTWDIMRTPMQDVMFLVSQLVEIAGRALSPGINDPITAMTCLDWLAAALAKAARHDPPSRYRRDQDGKLRLVAVPKTFEDFLEASFGALRDRMCAERNAALHALENLDSLADDLASQNHRDAIGSQAAAYMDACRRTLGDDSDLARLQAFYVRIEQRCRTPASGA